MMYIALKWLIMLAFAMWCALILIDSKGLKLRKSQIVQRADCKRLTVPLHENKTMEKRKPFEKRHRNGLKEHQKLDTALIQYTMFFAGALVVTILNNKKGIALYTKEKTSHLKILLRKYCNVFFRHINKLIFITTLVTEGCMQNISEIVKRIVHRYKKKIKEEREVNVLNLLLLKKLKEISEERQKLGRLLLAAVEDNKHIRLQYQLETMAKNRLVRNIEETQKMIKENRSRYADFQRLYLITHQENIFLKARVKRLTSQKAEAERGLMNVIRVVFQSKNSELIDFCSSFIVQSNMENDTFNSDFHADIKKMHHKPRHPTESQSDWQISQSTPVVDKVSWSNSHVPEIMDDRHSLSLLNYKPKLRGLPGEYLWTVKDKNGIIEKLYEYDYGYHFDKVETHRKIREYTVYHDKDCILDFAKSRSLQAEKEINNTRVQNQRFLTSSKPFQEFLRDIHNAPVSNTPIVSK